MTIIPLAYAIHRLTSVTDLTVIDAILNFFEDDDTIRALKFTMLEAIISTIMTLLVGLPVAWYLGRYKWKNIRTIRALLSVPFVTPSIAVSYTHLTLPTKA